MARVPPGVEAALRGGDVAAVQTALAAAPSAELFEMLYLASLARQRAVVSVLLRAGADINGVGRDGHGVLYAATRSADDSTDFIEFLLSAGADANGPPSHRGEPLFQAVFLRSRPLLRSLLAHGADPNSPLMANGGGTPLYTACLTCSAGNVDMMRMLLNAGASVNPPGDKRPLAILLSNSKAPTEALSLLMAHGPSVPLSEHKELVALAAGRSLAMLKRILHMFPPADPTVLDHALQRLTWSRRTESQQPVASPPGVQRSAVVRALLSLGANPHARFAHNHTPLHRAAEMMAAAIPPLLECGADLLEDRNEDGWTPLHLAVPSVSHRRTAESFRLLVLAGADLAARTKQGLTAKDLYCRDHSEAAWAELLPRMSKLK